MEDRFDLDLAYQSFSKIIQLTNDEINLFRSIAEIAHYPKKSTILQPGQVCNYEYFILQGIIRSYSIDEAQVEHTLLFAKEGWWTGNLKSFVREIPSTFYLECLEPTVTIRLDKTAIDLIYSKIPKFERYFRILLQNRLLATQDRIENHLSSTAKERYSTFCQQYPDLIQRIPQKYMASYLGITPTYLSRLRASYI